MVAYASGRGRAPSKPVTEERVTTALLSGKGLFVAIEGDEQAPSLLGAAADAELTLPAPSGSMLAAVAMQTGEGTCDPLPDSLAALVRPFELVSASRPAQTAVDYARRLERLLACREPPSRPASAVLPTAEWTLDTLPLASDVESWARQLGADLISFAAGKLAWADVEHGALLVGPPGCGKTTLVEAIANTCRVPLIVTSYATLEGGADGRGRYTDILRNMRATFAEARANAPCILFFDEIDSVLGRGLAGHNESWYAPITNTLLTETSADSREGVVFLGATNLPDRVDPALRRSGRLDRMVLLAPPGIEQVGRIIGAHLPTLAGSEREEAAIALVGHTGADIARLARGARRRARQAGREIIAQDLISELEGGVPARSADQRHRIAVHEAGHVLVTEVRRPGAVDFVSIRALASHPEMLGHVSALLPDMIYTLPEIEGYLTELLAGRAAEVLVLGEASVGAAGDLQRATSFCVAIELSLGLGSRLSGIGALDHDEAARSLMMRPEVAKLVEERLAAAHQAATSVLAGHRDCLDRLIASLLAYGALTGPVITSLVTSSVLH